MARQYNDPNVQYSASNTTYNGVTTVTATAEAGLGGLVASAVVSKPSFPGGNPWYRKPKVEQVEKVREPVVVSAFALARLGGVRAFADTSVVWSILEDEAELLLLI